MPASTGISRLRPRRPPEGRPAAPTAQRLISGSGRLFRRRPGVLAVALLGRLRVLRAWSMWPDPERPSFVTELGAEAPARWLTSSFERRPGRPEGGGPRSTLRRLAGPATWSAVRARAVLVGRPDGIAGEAFELGFGRPAERPRLALYSVGQPTSKSSCFVFEAGAQEPSAVIRMMPDRGRNESLRAELKMIEAVRRDVSNSSVLAALPEPPLYRGEVRGEYVVVLPADPLAPATGSEDRATALGWLRALQDATRVERDPWGPGDERVAVAAIRRAWAAAGRDLDGRLTAPFVRLRGASLFACTVHGDFWRGNIAIDRGEVRVYDWEWARLEGEPFFDLWVYELGELRLAARRGGAELVGPLELAVHRVRRELADRGLDPQFARATLASSIAELALRGELAAGVDPALLALMAAAEELLGRLES